jgi:uncharacterized damage-inducible protein DinB
MRACGRRDEGNDLADSMTTARDVYRGWETYHDHLIEAISPLTTEQLSYRTEGSLRSIEEICRHIIGARARWCTQALGLDGDPLEALGHWDAADAPERSAAELVEGLRASWTALWAALGSWSVTDLAYTIPNTDRDPGEPENFTRQWVVWHLIEHDVHHGGEVSLILGSHGLSGLDI